MISINIFMNTSGISTDYVVQTISLQSMIQSIIQFLYFKISQLFNMKKQSAVMTHYYNYPENDVHCYKKHIYQEEELEPKGKTQVLDVKKAVAKREREMVRELEDKKKMIEKEVLQNKLRQQIAFKKRQIEELEIQRQKAEDEQLKSFELARIREEQLKKQRIEKEKRKNQLNKLARQRGEDANRRQQEQRQQLEAKQREAQRRRDVATVAQRKQRKKAIKYREDQEAVEQVKQTKTKFEDFNKNHGVAKYNKNIDYSKTFLHNPVVVRAKEQVQMDAHQKARIMQQEIEARRQRKQQIEEQQRFKIDERSADAFRRLSADKMAQQLKIEAQQQLLRYNHEKIQIGKRDQGIGIRPLTRVQKQHNKQLRDEQEFEKIFFQGKNTDWISQPVQKYQIQAARQVKRKQPNIKKQTVISKRVSQSRIPQASTVRYSFQDEALSVGSQYDIQKKSHHYESNNQQQQIRQPSEKSSNSKYQTGLQKQNSPLAQTKKSAKIPLSPPKVSVKDAKIKGSKNNNSQGLKGERRIVYNHQTSQSRESQAKISPIKRSQQSSHLNNLCQNRQHSDLSYSEDEDDSLQA